MKVKIFSALFLSAMLLTACNSEQSLIDEREGAGTSAVQQTAETVTTAVESGTEVSKEVNAEETDADVDTKLSDHFDNFTFDLKQFEKESSADGYKTDGHSDFRLLSKNLLCAVYQTHELDSDWVYSLRFYDIDKKEMLAEVPIPENNSFFTYSHEKSDDDNVLVKAYFMSAEGLGLDGFGEITVYNDYSYSSTTEYGSVPYPGIDYFSTGIYANDSGTNNIENLRTDAVLAGEENGIALYVSSIDEKRFIFRQNLWDGGGYIGIYDYSSGSVTKIPESDNLEPIGYYKGKIYAYVTNSAYSKSGESVGTIYSFEAEDFEKKEFMTFHTPDNSAESGIKCYAAHDCGYMTVSLRYNIYDETDYIVFLDSGEILAKHESGQDGTTAMECFDGRIVLVNSGNDMITIFDKKM